jgi:hypothetical protein
MICRSKVYGMVMAAMMLVVAVGVRAASMVVNVSCGYLYGAGGTAPADRLDPGTLCVLVADIGGDGFDPPARGWVADDDVVLTVFDEEYLLASGGTKGFDLASGGTEPGLFSRSLGIDLAQFGGRTAPLPVALRWFPGYRAAGVNVATDVPAPGTVYGEFRRLVPMYPEAGTSGWTLPIRAGVNVTLDPIATAEFGGVDAPAVAAWVISPVIQPSGLVLDAGTGGATKLRFLGGPGMRYRVQRSGDLRQWSTEGTVVADGGGQGLWTELSVLAGGRAFYRVVGPLPQP